jgi:aminoglycoside phosphotransferase (APT) family kinase protein
MSTPETAAYGSKRGLELQATVSAIAGGLGFGAPLSLSRLSGGMVNKVFRVDWRNLPLILRVNEDCLDVFQKEHWAMKQAANVGVNVPIVHEIGERDGISFMLMEYVAGPTLDEFRGNRYKIFADLGRQVQLINSIPVKGFGFHLDLSRVEFTKTWQEVAQEQQENIFGEDVLIRIGAFSSDEIAPIKAFLAPMMSWMPSPQLCHCDINWGNVIVQETERVVILDWTLTQGGPAPLFDLAHASVHADGAEFKSMCAGYGLSPESVRQLLPDLHRIALSKVLRAAVWAHDVGHGQMSKFKEDIVQIMDKISGSIGCHV